MSGRIKEFGSGVSNGEETYSFGKKEQVEQVLTLLSTVSSQQGKTDSCVESRKKWRVFT